MAAPLRSMSDPDQDFDKEVRLLTVDAAHAEQNPSPMLPFLVKRASSPLSSHVAQG